MTDTPDRTADKVFLLIDAGNTRVKWALSDGGAPLLAVGALAADLVDGPDPAVPAWTALRPPHSVWLSNVAGAAVAARLAGLVRAHWPGVALHTLVAQPSQCGVTNGYRDSAQLGSDRWAALIGARAAYPGEHLLVVTLGTATTVERMDAQGHFAGGLIAPGWALMMASLGQRAAQLPALDDARARELLRDVASGDATRGRADFATDTHQAIVRGCLWAQTALIEQAWRAFGDEVGAPVRCVVSGGAADAVSAALPIPHTRRQHLVLSGMALIASSTVAQG